MQYVAGIRSPSGISLLTEDLIELKTTGQLGDLGLGQLQSNRLAFCI